MTEKYPELKELFFYLHDLRLRNMLEEILDKNFDRKSDFPNLLSKKKVGDAIDKLDSQENLTMEYGTGFNMILEDLKKELGIEYE